MLTYCLLFLTQTPSICLIFGGEIVFCKQIFILRKMTPLTKWSHRVIYSLSLVMGYFSNIRCTEFVPICINSVRNETKDIRIRFYLGCFKHFFFYFMNKSIKNIFSDYLFNSIANLNQQFLKLFLTIKILVA